MADTFATPVKPRRASGSASLANKLKTCAVCLLLLSACLTALLGVRVAVLLGGLG